MGDLNSHIKKFKSNSLAVVSTKNSECGIAEYSGNLFRPVEKYFKSVYYLSNKDIADRICPDEPNVFRIWEFGETDFDPTVKFIKDHKIDIVHIQYHSGSHYPPIGLDNLISKLKNEGKVVYLTFHAVRGKGFDFMHEVKNLKLVDRLFIHNKADYDYASTKLSNVVLFTLPSLEFKSRDKKKLRKDLGLEGRYPIIATHGLMNKNKGVKNVIYAIRTLKEHYPDILFLSVNAVVPNNSLSFSIFDECENLVDELGLNDNVRFFTEFLDDKLVEILLQSSDINVLAYEDAGESASAAVRKCLASLNPTIVTDIKQFDEFKSEVFKVKDNSPESIANGIKELLSDPARGSKIVDSAKSIIEKNSYEKKSLELLNLYANN